MMDEIAVKQCIISFFQIMDNQANELVCMICGLWKHNRLKKKSLFQTFFMVFQYLRRTPDEAQS